ncbi:MAG: 3-hydroxyacyl-CoA dehydrogenase NAD-binding domain-containing protein [Myxococcaceae bacterium]|jgi:3-hydroxyacyl-CoA dehydrogenase|nr:3-hydroxyacyl-CoA dehydrogenase NAD-binding domain-containing protein [Myxococcaceae bacterium]
MKIRKVAVLGAGVMGSGIAAHLANAGIPVLLLDIVPPKAEPTDKPDSKAFRNKFALSALTNLVKQKPAPLMTQKALSLIEVGNFDDDLAKVKDCDWIVEVIKEDLKLKNDLFKKLEKLAHDCAIVSSNTSGMSIKGMTEGTSLEFKKRFLVTHFFNPVRYMKLLELVAGEHTDPAILKAVHTFGERTLGKGIVYGKDTTNFIANRIGTYGMMRTLQLMKQHGLSIEEIDKIFGPAMGRPSSAVFRTADLVGLDTFFHVTKNCYDSLPNDEARDTFKPPAFLEKMIEKKMLGDKTQGGFYKKQKGGEGEKEILVLDLDTLEYRAQNKVRFESLGAAKDVEDLPERIRTVLGGSDKAATFAEQVTLDTLAYASRRLGEIADDYVNIDRGMRWGFAWDMGPFEVWDAYGVEKGVKRMKELGITPAPWVEEMLKSGRATFYGRDGVNDTFWDVKAKASKPVDRIARQISVELLKRGNKKVDGNDSATVWDMGDGVLQLELHTKMNSIDTGIIEMMNKAVDHAEKNFRGIVIGNDGANFSAGANIAMLLWAIKDGQWEDVRKLVGGFQAANQRLRYSSIPVVTAPFQLTLGGGAELTMAGNFVQAAAETYIGLVEVGVGLIPGGGGNLQLLRNLYGMHQGSKDMDALPFLKKAFLAIGTAKVATSAEEAKEAGFFTPKDGISMSRDHQLADAKAVCIGLAEGGFRPPRPATFFLPGKSGAATIDMMLYDMQLNHQISEHDRLIGKKLASVLTGGDTSASVATTEARLLELELEAFLSLCGEEKTQARIEHMLLKGKPLRN